MGIEVLEVTIEGKIIIMVDLTVKEEDKEDHNNIEIKEDIPILTNHNNLREINQCNSSLIKEIPIKISNSLICLLSKNKSHHNNNHK